jgi:hypothetical protein
MTTRVFTIDAELLANARARHANGGFLTIAPRKVKPGAAKPKVTYLDARVNLDGKPAEGWFRFDNGTVKRDAADPDDADDVRNQYKSEGGGGLRNIIEAKHALLAEFIELMDIEYQAEIKRLIESKAITIGKQDIKPLIVTTYREGHEKAGERMPDEYISVNLKIDFNKYPEKYPHKHLRGTVKTQICDAEKQYTDPKTGRVLYETAKIGDALIGQDNFHELIKRDAEIVMCRFHTSSVAISQGFVSMPIECAYIVIKEAGPGGFSDEVVNTGALEAALAAKPVEAPKPVEQPKEDGNAGNPPPQVDEVANLLQNI